MDPIRTGEGGCPGLEAGSSILPLLVIIEIIPQSLFTFTLYGLQLEMTSTHGYMIRPYSTTTVTTMTTVTMVNY